MLFTNPIPFSPRYENQFRDYLFKFSKATLGTEKEKEMDGNVFKEIVEKEVTHA